jgi:hypothetical protein
VTPLEALYRCQRAWEATQPQLFMELWPDDGLDERETGALALVEPARHTPSIASPAGGLNPGAEPCRDLLGTDGESALLTAAPAHGKTEPDFDRANGSAAGASAPLTNQTGRGRSHPQGTRGHGQEVTV